MLEYVICSKKPPKTLVAGDTIEHTPLQFYEKHRTELSQGGSTADKYMHLYNGNPIIRDAHFISIFNPQQCRMTYIRLTSHPRLAVLTTLQTDLRPEGESETFLFPIPHESKNIEIATFMNKQGTFSSKGYYNMVYNGMFTTDYMFFGKRPEIVYATYKMRGEGYLMLKFEVNDPDAIELERQRQRLELERSQFSFAEEPKE